MLNHVVLMKFKPGVSEADIADLEALLDDLPNRIMEIQMYEFGRDILKTPRSYDFAIVSLFANTDTLRRYQNHSDHLVVAEKLKRLCDSVLTVDFEGTDAGDLKTKSPMDVLLADDR
jgi:hypothetical protein